TGSQAGRDVQLENAIGAILGWTQIQGVGDIGGVVDLRPAHVGAPIHVFEVLAQDRAGRGICTFISRNGSWRYDARIAGAAGVRRPGVSRATGEGEQYRGAV